MKSIPLTKGKEALVDDEDHEYLSQWCWHVAAGNYAARDTRNFARTSGQYIYMHDVVAHRAGYENYTDVDHKDGNGLNNTRGNLRPTTHQNNQANRGPQTNNTSGFKGVVYDRTRDRWKAQIKVSQRTRFLGRFDSKIEAAKAYNAAAIKHFGEFAYLNPV